MPEELLTLWHRYTNKLGDEFFIQAGLQFLREAYTAQAIGKALNVTKVRLCTENNNPDFELEVNGIIWPFEVTEVLDRNRKRGDEYKRKKFAKGKIHCIDNRLFRSDTATEALKNASIKKSKKAYPPNTNLAIYFNNYWPYPDQFENIFTDGTEPAKNAFKRILFNTMMPLYSVTKWAGNAFTLSNKVTLKNFGKSLIILILRCERSEPRRMEKSTALS